MILAFNSALLREICEKQSSAVKYLGEEVAIKLMTRLADLIAAQTIHDVIMGSPKIYGQECEIFLTSNTNMYLQQNYPPNYGGKNALDWASVKRVKLMRIANVE